MKGLVIAAVLLAAGYLVIRLRTTFRRNRMDNKADDIQKRLSQLRKKRDEE